MSSPSQRLQAKVENSTVNSAPPSGVLTWLLRPHVALMSLIFFAALVVGWFVLPGEDERIDALERDGQAARALDLLEGRFSRGDRRQRTLVQLQRFYVANGDTQKLRQVLELLAEQRPRDLYVFRQLAQLYRQVQDEPSQIKALNSQLAIRYSDPVCNRLIGLFRHNGDFAAEQATLKQCRAAGYRKPSDLVRLAFLEAADGNIPEAAKIMAAVDDRRWLRDGRDRLMLFETLLDVKRPEEALRRGTRWLKGQPDEELALDFVSRFVQITRNDLALQLARDVGTPGDAVTLAVGEILVEQTQLSAARAFLAGWFEGATAMSTETATRFVSAAIDAGDPVLALRAAERQGMSTLSQAELASLAESLAAAGNGPAFDKVTKELQPETVISFALVAAAIEIRQGRMEPARQILTSVRTDELDERRLLAFERIVDQLGRPRTPAITLREPTRPPATLPPPAITTAPTDSQLRRGTPPQDVSRRFRLKRKRTEPQRKEKETAPASVPSQFNPFKAN
ncbi:MAG: hypothetical protein HOO99_18650 [Hyphomicrobiaceae bacterium]|nr:hypothetical protein [Hyphomicrobiaceae bacterium]